MGGIPVAEGHIQSFGGFAGAVHNLGTLGVSFSKAFAITERGDIVGQTETAHSEFHGFI